MEPSRASPCWGWSRHGNETPAVASNDSLEEQQVCIHHLMLEKMRERYWDILRYWKYLKMLSQHSCELYDAQGISMSLRRIYAQVLWMAPATNKIHRSTPHAAIAKVPNQWPAGTARNPCRGRTKVFGCVPQITTQSCFLNSRRRHVEHAVETLILSCLSSQYCMSRTWRPGLKSITLVNLLNNWMHNFLARGSETETVWLDCFAHALRLTSPKISAACISLKQIYR